MLHLLTHFNYNEQLKNKKSELTSYESDYVKYFPKLVALKEKEFLKQYDDFYSSLDCDKYPEKKVLAHHLKGDYYFQKDSLTEALVCYESAAELARSLGFKKVESVLIKSMIKVYLLKQNWINLTDLFQRNDEIFEELDEVQEKITNLLYLSLSYQFVGQLDESAKILKSITSIEEPQA